MPARSQKTSGEKRKQDRARNQGYILGRQKREGKASPTEERKARDVGMGRAGFLV